MTTSKHIENILSTLPSSPGVYQMKNEKGEIIYIGKAKRLKNRVRSYFLKGGGHSPKTKRMVKEIADIHYIETNSDLDAFLLETNLIKQYRPPYNILMRDDKFFVYLKLTNEDFPRVSITRQVQKDGGWYFGPKTSRSQVVHTLKLLRKLFPIRDCKLLITEHTPGSVEVKNNDRGKLPCLDYHIEVCSGPCDGSISKEDYQQLTHEIKQFLKGSYHGVLRKLEEEMKSFAEQRAFEQAAKRRDLIFSIKKLMEKQEINEAQLQSRDVIAYVEQKGQMFFNIFMVREGKIINQENIILEGDSETPPQEVLAAFLRNYYSVATDIPKEVYTEFPLDSEEEETISSWLSALRGNKVTILNAQRGVKHDTLLLAKKNAISFAKQQQIKWLQSGNTIISEGPKELQKAINLPNTPKRIECYDISHLGGTNTVGSMVVMEDGRPKNAHYRSFTLRSIESGEIDDFKSMKEVLTRRLRHLTRIPSTISIKKCTGKHKDLFNQFQIPFTDLAYGVFENDICLLLITFEHIDKDQLLILDLAGTMHTNDPLFPTLFTELIKKVHKNHLYVLSTEQTKAFYMTMGFGVSAKTPASLQESPNLLHRKPQKQKRDVSLSATPDVIIIDGGKGQLSSAMAAQEIIGTSIPMIGLAKREEEIVLPSNKLIKLPDDNPGLLLIRQLRDEAHRFAVSHQAKKHRKKTTASLLDEIPGIGKTTRKKLLNTFGSVPQIKQASEHDLIPVVGPVLAKKIVDYFQ